MLSVNELIEPDLRDPEREIQRLGLLLSGMESWPQADKARFAGDVLAVVVNPDEKLARRTTAALMLGVLSEPLEIRQSVSTAKSLYEVLERSFLSGGCSRESVRERIARLSALAESQLFFFNAVVHAIFLIDSADGLYFRKVWALVVADKMTVPCLAGVVRKVLEPKGK